MAIDACQAAFGAPALARRRTAPISGSMSLNPRHVACAQCAAVNRVPADRLGDDPNCGQCGRPLLTGAPIELNDASFDAVVGKTDLPVVVDFWAPWCGPCRQMAPAFAQAAALMKGQALFVKVNSDDSQRLAGRFGIRSIPTLVRLDRGQEVQRRSGALPTPQIVAFAR